MPSGCHFTSTWSWVINLCWRGLVVIKGSGIAYQWTSRRGKMWRFRNGYGRWQPEEVLSNRNPTTPQEKEELVEFFRKNIDVFAWNAYEALGVDPSFIYHHLNINPSSLPKINHLDAHPRNMQMLLKMRWWSSSRQGLSRKSSTLNG